MSDRIQSPERDDAESVSRNCLLCSGAGMALVYHRDWVGGRIGYRETETVLGNQTRVAFAAEIAAHCICPLGRWMRAKTASALLRRIPDGAAIVEGRSLYSFDPPGSNDGGPDAAPTRDEINALFRRPV